MAGWCAHGERGAAGSAAANACTACTGGVLEVGCFTGYAALWMALALPPGGRLVSLERDGRAAEMARRHLAAGGVSDRVEVRLGDALESLSTLPTNEP